LKSVITVRVRRGKKGILDREEKREMRALSLKILFILYNIFSYRRTPQHKLISGTYMCSHKQNNTEYVAQRSLLIQFKCSVHKVA